MRALEVGREMAAFAGQLADDLFRTEAAWRDVRQRVERMLNQIFPAAGALIDPAFGVGWSHWSSDASRGLIEVFSAVDSVDAAALHGFGFVAVLIHDHSAARTERCACQTRRVQ